MKKLFKNFISLFKKKQIVEVAEDPKAKLKETLADESLTDIQKIRAYLNDETNKTEAINEAEYLRELTHGNWFTLDRIADKIKSFPKEQLLAKLDRLFLFDYCLTRNDRGVEEFKIVLKKEEKIRFYQLLIEKLEKKKQHLLTEIERLSEKAESK